MDETAAVGPVPGRVSVVMPARDVERYVQEAIDSVCAQDWPDVELVAVDDGSTDATGDLIRTAARAADWSRPSRRLVALRLEGVGAGAARNAALARASGDLIAFLDADDRWHPALLSRMVAALRERPALVMAFPRLRHVDEAGEPTGVESRFRAEAFDVTDLMVDNPVHSASGVVARRDVVEAAGRFDETLKACIDLDYWVRLGAGVGKPFGAVDEILADYRKRPGQITGDWRRMETGWRRVAEKLAESGRPLPDRDLARAQVRLGLVWSALAYASGDYAASRRLTGQVWWRDPSFALRNRDTWIRTAAAGASLLPRPHHDAIRRRWNAWRGV